MKRLGMALALALTLGACEKSFFLDQRTTPDRAKYSADMIPEAPVPPVQVVNPDPRTPGGPAVPVLEVAGTWTFTVPPTVTRVEHRTDALNEISLFVGRPAPTDTPFMVITTTRDRKTRSENDPAFKIENQREYSMNVNIAREWTGLTATGAVFSEIVVRRPGPAGDTGDVCRAIALARTEDEQKLALSILSSIAWTPAR